MRNGENTLIEQKFKEIIALAEKIYKLDLSDVVLVGDITGYRMIGQACGGTKVRYSPAHLADNPDYYLNEILPHEIAHIVCQRDPRQGSGHDKWWRRVAQNLGCSLPRATVPAGTFNIKAKKRKSAKTYTYVDTLGGVHELSGQRHARIQKHGQTYTVIETEAEINSKGYRP